MNACGSILLTVAVGTWVNKGRETLLNHRLCSAEAAHAKAQTRSSSGTRRDRGVFGHGIFVAGLVRRGVRAVADGIRTLPPRAGRRPLASQLLPPGVSVVFRECRFGASGVLVPEASMDEQRCAVLRQHDVRLARQVPAVQPTAVAHRVQRPPHRQLRFRILRPYARHYLGAFLRVNTSEDRAASTYSSSMSSFIRSRSTLTAERPRRRNSKVQR